MSLQSLLRINQPIWISHPRQSISLTSVGGRRARHDQSSPECRCVCERVGVWECVGWGIPSGLTNCIQTSENGTRDEHRQQGSQLCCVHSLGPCCTVCTYSQPAVGPHRHVIAVWPGPDRASVAPQWEVTHAEPSGEQCVGRDERIELTEKLRAACSTRPSFNSQRGSKLTVRHIYIQ